VEDGLLRLPGIRARLASFKVPKANYRIDELPRNAMGKIDKPQLRARLGS
jgi:non-ribosomal peptide synthetase component E (peptide arylation enzyme)